MRGPEPVFLTLDLGTSAAKVALVSLSGQVLSWASAPIALQIIPGGGAEQRPEDWWQAFVSAAHQALKAQPDAARQVTAICCSTQGEGTIPVDQQGRALSNCLLWMDMRGAEPLRRQLGGIINLEGAGLFNLLRLIWLTGGAPSMTGKDPAGHMLFIRDAMPEVYARTHKFLNVLDYMNLQLTGRCVASTDSILTSWVTDNRNADDVHYDRRLIHMLGIDAEKLPEIVPCRAVIGTLKPEVAATLGLPGGIKVVAGSIDNTAAAIGAGTVENYLPHLYLGTSSWIAAHVPFKKTDPFAGMASIPCAVPGRYLLTALQATAGGNLTFLRDNILYHKDELLQEEHVPDIFKVLDQIASRSPAGSNGVFYTPWIWGERAPVNDPSLRAGLYNLSLHNTRADILRAFLEGVAFNTRWLLKPVEKFTGRSIDVLHMAGGGAASDLWCQIMADVLGLHVHQLQDPIQANVRGAAWIAAVGLGEIGFRDIPRLVKFKQIYQPNPTRHAVYTERFEIFIQIYRQMRPVFKRLNRNA